VSPVTVQGELVHPTDWMPPGVEVAVYAVAGVPPAGVKDTDA
jgi:hypothetical protein